MAAIAPDDLLTRAQQGNLRAISAVLNRQLIPQGAHAKVRQNKDCLDVLVVSSRVPEPPALTQMVQQTLLALKPATFTRVKIYRQQFGRTNVTWSLGFDIPPASQPLTQADPVAEQVKGVMPLVSAPPERSPEALKHRPSPPLTPEQPDASNPGRYSVAEFLAEVTSVEELELLKHHPFMTGQCPQCHTSFQAVNPPPLYWDCPQCSWVDDLSQVLPSEHIRRVESSRSLIYLKRIGNYLVEAGLLTKAQINVALADQAVTGMRLGEVLVQRGWIKEETIEYLMQKVIMPERSGSHGQAANYLESSRNLLKTLLNEMAPPTADGERTSPNAQSSTAQLRSASQRDRDRDIPSHERETLILPDPDVANL